jgi:hypothetical protein
MTSGRATQGPGYAAIGGPHRHSRDWEAPRHRGMPKSSYTPATAGSWALSWPREPRAPPWEVEPLRASLRAGATGSCRSHSVASGSTRSGGGWTRPSHWAGEGAGPGHRREIRPSKRYRDRVTLDGGEG